MPAARPAAPAVATPRVMAPTAGAFYLAGGVAALAVVLGSPFPTTAARLHLGALAVTALLAGALLVLLGRALPRWAFHLVAGSGTALITLAVPVCPTIGTALAISAVYLFVAVFVVFFCTWRQSVAHLVLLACAGAWALCDRPGVTPGVSVSMGVVLTFLSVVTGLLVQRAASAGRDSLTGLANRRGFDDALDGALAATARTGAPLSAALLDVDHFKRVNDRSGHAAGDDLLRAVARECRAALPAGAVLARYGGDEFAVLLPGVPGPAALERVEALRTASRRAGLSCGVAELSPGESGADLMRRADSALYAAKAAGRGQSRLLDDASAALAHDLAAALAAGDVRAWFQPLVDPADGAVVGVEALARWTHAERGAVPPLEFVHAAETSGLVHELGPAVLADACRGALAVRAAAGRELLLTVNVSGRELARADYPRRVLDVLAATGFPATSLVLEVTESVVDASSEQALAALRALREHGIAVAIDDFGTGYSAFSRLDTLPADYLKLDAGFTADITTSPRRAGMLEALLGLSRTLGLEVVAEGVETPEQARLLAEMGCPLAQGWLFSRPVPPRELAERLARAPQRTGAA
ncbi:putative bifunctional diguanylate cyclase/phosphodiesterase [Kineococcus sp. SYSU DK005]|uniref:putative bifunctional diguanylate cyclase/phosphodiesterase n=1 Tax=Kineococcus sp. SYSU DK005 TaxID=3383126 RepID=UPI003D7DAC13